MHSETSYTIGQGVQDFERFPAQTVQLLRDQDINVIDPKYIAMTGWTTANLISAINLENPSKDFDIVTLLIGVNDQYQHRDTNGYRTRFTEALNKAVDLAGGRNTHVFVLSIPDYSVTPFVSESDKARVSMQIDQFNGINKEITLQTGITYIDITPSTRQAANDASLIANDGLHPSGKEYSVWANMLAPLIKKVLIADYRD
ncbi:MAG: GDSL-type esterase/lipase family protein [Segetibacter sp.]